MNGGCGDDFSDILCGNSTLLLYKSWFLKICYIFGYERVWRGILKLKVQQNTSDLSVSGIDKNILKICRQFIKEIFQNHSPEKNYVFSGVAPL